MGEFHNNRMPFGVKNGPAIFQRLSDRVLTDCMEFIRVYIDDIIVFSHDIQSHCGHLREVLKRLEQSGLTANRAKCQFGKTHHRPCSGRW